LAIRFQNYQSLPIESQPHPETIIENGHQCGGRTLQKKKGMHEKDVKRSGMLTVQHDEMAICIFMHYTCTTALVSHLYIAANMGE
jgi:hypothetical protein